jgi:hypothetical protein
LPLSQVGPVAVQTEGWHLQRPVAPSHVEWALHGVTVENGQLLASSAQWIEELPEQESPGVLVVVQPLLSAEHWQVAAPAVGVAQAWCVPQGTGVSA